MDPKTTWTDSEMAAAFNTWMRRYIDNPEMFERDWQSVKRYLDEEREGEPTYGQTCTALLQGLAGKRRDVALAPAGDPQLAAEPAIACT